MNNLEANSWPLKEKISCPLEDQERDQKSEKNKREIRERKKKKKGGKARKFGFVLEFSDFAKFTRF